MERQKFLFSLYEQLEDKSKILLNKKVVSFKHEKDSVTVYCEDGSVFIADIVVGADGVHSKTRQEMQRIAKEEGPPGLMDKDKNSKSSPYNFKTRRYVIPKPYGFLKIRHIYQAQQEL